MTADLLRLILAVAGVALVVGIYLWERHKREDARVQAIRQAQDRARASAPETAGEDDGGGVERELQRLDRILAERRDPGEEPRKGRGSKRSAKADRAKGRRSEPRRPPPAEGEQAELPLDGETYWMDLPESVPFKIVQINVVATGAWLTGEQIETACREVELVPGDMKIFHRYDRSGRKSRVLYSLANMVEPGQFPLEDMSTLSTPGVTLFAQLPGPRDSLAIFSDMLFTAERLAALLDAELQDESHSALTRQTIEHTREEILEHRRQIQLARKKKA